MEQQSQMKLYSQHMYKLGNSVPLLYDNLLGPVYEGGVGILHPHRDHRGKNVQGLADDGPCLQGMCLQQAVEDL